MEPRQTSGPLNDPLSMHLWQSDPASFAERLGADFERFGFATVKDHDLSPALIVCANDAMKAFFALPDDDKARYRSRAGGARGYTPFGIETAKGAVRHDLKEF